MIIRRSPNSTLLNSKHHRSEFPWIHNCPLPRDPFVPNIGPFWKHSYYPTPTPCTVILSFLEAVCEFLVYQKLLSVPQNRCLGFVFNYNTLTHKGSPETPCFSKNIRLRPDISILHKVSPHILLLSNANWGLDMTLISYQGIPACSLGYQTQLRLRTEESLKVWLT